LHVPDGVFPLWILAALFVVSIITLIISVKRINKRFDERVVPYMGVLAAVIFAAQFVNFPVPPSSGHLVGTTLLAVMLGPWAAIIIIALVLFIQALYGDGGLLSYGLNVFNIGVFSAFFGWILALGLFKLFKRFTDEKKSVLIATAIASYFTTVVAAFILGLELFAVPAFGAEALLAITAVHAIIGIGEAILTFVILLYFVRANPRVISFLKESDVAEMAWVTDSPILTPQEGEVSPLTTK
jgi:cobalt/nickel transport system permease protein